MLKNPIFKMTVTLIVIAVVVAAAMAFVNQITAPLIAQNDANTLKEALAEVLKADDYQLADNADAAAEEAQVYQAYAQGQPAGICVLATATGYGGDVEVLTGIGTDGKVTGVKVLKHSETPGLGANSEKESFTSQYKEKSGTVGVAKTAPKDGEIQAISGATITSKAVTSAVNTSLELAAPYLNK